MPLPPRDRDQRLQGPLAGVRIIEMGQLLAGPFAASRLADFGAEVIKVEPPGKGDPLRVWGHHRFRDQGLWWPVMGRNKKSVTANLRDPRGQQLVRRLVADADALIENFKPGTLESWGLGPEVLHAVNPGLIITRISGYGQDGPYADRPGFASAGEALGGLRYINGYPDQPPPRAGISLGDTLTGMFAAQGLLMALYRRDALGGGQGQVIDAAISEACFSFMESALPEYDKLGVVREPSGTGLANIAPSNIYRSSDGKWVIIAANFDPMFVRLCEAIGRPELAADEKFSDHLARGRNAAELDGLIGEWAAARSAAEITETLNAHSVVVGPIYSIADIAHDPHFRARGMIQRVEDERYDELAVPGFVPKFSNEQPAVAWLGRDRPGADNDEVYRGVLQMSAGELEELQREGVI